MKHLIIILLSFILSSCSYYCNFYDENLDFEWKNVNIDQTFDVAYEAMEWIYVNINYKTDEEGFGKRMYEQIPNETIKNGFGDCVDMAALLAAIIRRDLKSDVEFIETKTDNLNSNHMMIKYGSYVYDCQNNNFFAEKDYKYPVIRRYNMDEMKEYIRKRR